MIATLCNRIDQVVHDKVALSQVSMFALNTLILVGKLTDKIPKFLTQACFAFFPFHCLLRFPEDCKELDKRISDLKGAIKEREPTEIVLTALKVATKATDILLGFGSLAGALILLTGGTATALYALLSPIGVASFVVTTALRIVDFAKNHQKLQEKTPISLGDHLIRQLDLKTVETLGEAPSEQTLKKGLRLHRLKMILEVGLSALGHIALLIYRAYPNTLLQASTSWCVSLLYTAKCLFEVRARSDLLASAAN